ncbi:MAG: hydantoinase B/oxoprolinase family protein [Desulfobacteraceae bacterium]
MDPITFTVVAGLIESITREMTVILERTARSPILKVAHDFSNGLFDWHPRMIAQGERDSLSHLGSMIYMVKEAARFFGDDIHPGDIIYHNDPEKGGGHLPDATLLRPVFHDGELIFWACSKAHQTDTGGIGPGGYHPEAEEIYQEGIRIPPVKFWEKGKERRDVINLYLANVRYPVLIRGDLMAQLAATGIAERNLLRLLKKYGKETLKICVDKMMDICETKMREWLASLPDGEYHGSSWVQDDGHGSGDFEIKATVKITDEKMDVSLSSPPQTKSYINSYYGNTISEIYGAILSQSPIRPPINEGLYKAVKVDCGLEGTVTNAIPPAACSLSVSLVGQNIKDAVAAAICEASTERASAGWGFMQTPLTTGINPRTGEKYTCMLLLSTAGGGGAVNGMDGWPTRGPGTSFGSLTCPNVEDIEYEYPMFIHSWEFRTDSGCAGKWRGGVAANCISEAIDHPVLLVATGVGDKFAASSVDEAYSTMLEPKLAPRFLLRKNLPPERISPNTVLELEAGDRILSCPQGGGGVGNPLERDPERVRMDVINELVSLEGAKLDYGVVIDPDTFEVNVQNTLELRKNRFFDAQSGIR